MYLIAGLGNPSLRYRHTRHNAGFDALDLLAKKYQISIKKKNYQGLVGEGKIRGEKVFFLKPLTFMNKSGESIFSFSKDKGIDLNKELIVLVDDITLDCGVIRIRGKGSAGGHNGLKSIITCCGTEEFMRIRIGVGKMPEGGDMIKHVLTRPSRADTKLLSDAYQDVIGAVETIIDTGIETAMSKFNGKRNI